MAVFDDFGDTPNQIRTEGQDITLTRTNTSASTVLLSWNLPPSVVSGCAEGVYKGAYNGIIITVNTSPFSIANTPVDGVKYTADPSGNVNLHVGDKIGSSLVVGALYGDNVTTSLEVMDVDNNKPLYFSAFAVTKQFKYHSEGVHAYEQPLGNTAESGTSGYQEIILGYQENRRPFDLFNFEYTTVSMQANDKTGLDPNQSYTLNFRSDLLPTETQITVHGSNTQTYNQLVDEINRQISLIGVTINSNGRPSIGVVYVDVDGQKVYTWNGDTNVLSPSVFSSHLFDAVLTTDDYWYDELHQDLYRWDGVDWVIQSFFINSADPSKELLWFNTTTELGYKYEGSGWCEQPSSQSVNDPRNPLVDPTVVALLNSKFWYNTTTQILYGAHAKIDGTVCWNVTEAIYDETDPNLYPPGYYWYDDKELKVYIRTGASPQVWLLQTGVTISDTEPTIIAPGDIWVDTVNDLLFLRNSTNVSWTSMPFVTWGKDPAVRSDCDLWWDSVSDLLFVWSAQDGVYDWRQVDFYQQATDPALPTVLERGYMWYNPDSEVVSIWDGTQWTTNNSVIIHSRDPVHGLSIGVDHHFDTLSGAFNRASSNSIFIHQDITSDVRVMPDSPTNLAVGVFWYNLGDDRLAQWSGSAWIENTTFVTQSPAPVVNTKYYDSSTKIVYQWIGYWSIAVPYARIGLTDQGSLLMTSTTLGCKSYVVIDGETVFSSLSQPVKIWIAYLGTDGLGDKPSYATLGIGTDGSSDERRELIDRIRILLGHPTVDVELTRQQLDHCIDLALQELRQKTSVAYQRVMFFLQTQPGVQKYKLTNKCVGFNKIVRVAGAYRMQSSYLGSAAGQGAYGQAMLQHLYQMGGFDLISYHLVSEYVELMNTMFASYLVYNWHEASRNLTFFQTFGGYEKILMDCFIERTEQELISDRLTKSWIEKFAGAKAKQILAGIRGKYGTLPGAGGGVSLNASDLNAQADAELQQCQEEIDNYQVDNPEDVGYESSFIMG